MPKERNGLFQPVEQSAASHGAHVFRKLEQYIPKLPDYHFERESSFDRRPDFSGTTQRISLMKTIIFSAVLALAVAAPGINAAAYAASFDGPFAGVSAGYNHDKVGPGLEGAAPLTRSIDRDSATFGFFAGYDKLVAGRVVLGAEAAFSIGADDKLDGNRGAATVTVDPKHSFDISARAGYLVTEKALLYVRGGYANIRARISTGNTAVINTNLDGWLAGAGIEYAITDHVNARLEYRYTDAGRNGSTYERQQVLVGASYRF
jgi:outer membrane immunogenic protein